MAQIKVKTRLKLREVKRRLAILPSILAGERPDPIGLRRYFFALFARRLFELIHTAFNVKSAGGTDDLGNNWRPLKPKTIKKRSSPSFIAKYPLSARLLINRVTDRLFKSFEPGRVTAAGYLPAAEQRYILQAQQLILGSDVPYFADVHKRRRLWPARMKAWINDAVGVALDFTMIRYVQTFPS